MSAASASLPRNAIPLPPPPTQPGQWDWLLSPSPQILAFATRNTLAALLSLAIAMWMELDSPAWAPMTVWAVAGLSRGESLSKARWRLFGTILGGLAAASLIIAFPQQPWLFFPSIAIWTGLCSGLATFVSNFRAYAMVLAGYTCAIVGMDAVSHPENIFFIAVSRLTYITLGIVCEAAIGLIFARGQEHAARMAVRSKLQTALSSVATAIADLMEETPEAISRARALFGVILRLSSEIEYAEIEMGPYGHEGDHARAALASVSLLLSRGMGLSARLSALEHRNTGFYEHAAPVRAFLCGLKARLAGNEATPALLADVQAQIRFCLALGAAEHPDTEGEAQSVRPLNERVLFVALAELLQDLDATISEYEASLHANPKDRFTFRLDIHRDPINAFQNGLRVAAAVLFSALVWEVTAWPSGQTFVTFTALVCGLFAVTDNPVLASLKFMWGVIWAAVAAAVLDFVFLPLASTYELAIACLGPAMFFGAIARGHPGYVLQSAAYGLLMPSMLGLGNAHRIDEVQYFNASSATVLGAAAAVLIFHVVLPFNTHAERFRLRREMLAELRSLCAVDNAPDPRRWLGRSIDRLARLIRHAGAKPSVVVEHYLKGALATMTMGLNIIRLHRLLGRDLLPDSARRSILAVLERISRSRSHYVAAARIAQIAIRRLRHLEHMETDLLTRLELERGISYLVLIDYAMRENPEFLDTRYHFTGRIDSLATADQKAVAKQVRG